jgi:hypothetical protein
MAKRRPVLTEQQREQRELVVASIEQLRSSNGWRAHLAARPRFRSYSPRNVLLILQQHPTATRVAGFRDPSHFGCNTHSPPSGHRRAEQLSIGSGALINRSLDPGRASQYRTLIAHLGGGLASRS